MTSPYTILGLVNGPPPRASNQKELADYTDLWTEVCERATKKYLHVRTNSPGTARHIQSAAYAVESVRLRAKVRGCDIYLRYEGERD